MEDDFCRVGSFFKIRPKCGDGEIAPRSGHRIVADDSNLYCIGGYNPDYWPDHMPDTNDEDNYYPLFKELWKFNLASRKWIKLKTSGDMPWELASHTVSLPAQDTMLVFGGTGIPFGDQSSNKLHSCNLKTLEWKEVECSGAFPQRIYGHSIALCGQYLYAFGGTTGFVYNSELHRLHLQTFEWEEMHEEEDKNIPEPRYRQELACDGKLLFIFGGGIDPHTAHGFNKLPAFNTEKERWEVVTTYPDPDHGFPAARRCHSCVQLRGNVYMCAGYNSQVIFNDLWRFNLDKLQWTKFSCVLPKPVYFHSAAVSQSGLMLIQGGVVNINHHERTADIYGIWLEVPSLADLAWMKMCYTVPDIEHVDRTELFELGVPLKYIERIEGTPTAA